jgi:diguanylate cyclase (GGDEF)-like protein
MRVLVAEDDPVSRKIVEVTLRQWKYEVISVADGSEALKALAGDDPPRLALLDWMMPGKDGPQICREFRAKPSSHYIYIILLTARSAKDDIVEGLEAGADDYIIKPFDAVELRARLLAGGRIVDLQDRLLEAQATHDGLTGILNRAAILDKLEVEFQRAHRQKMPLTVIMADIDRFKSINDTYGHQVGDAVLRTVAQSLSSTVRIYDTLGRYGGEEFLLVAPGCDAKEAGALCRRLQQKVRELAIDGLASNVTCSFGLVTTTADAQADTGWLIRTADDALYRAKANGRDRIETGG